MVVGCYTDQVEDRRLVAILSPYKSLTRNSLCLTENFLLVAAGAPIQSSPLRLGTHNIKKLLLGYLSPAVIVVEHYSYAMV